MKSQIVTSSWGGARRATPYAFTEQGVAILSSTLAALRDALLPKLLSGEIRAKDAEKFVIDNIYY